MIGWQPVGPEQSLILERAGEQQLHLGVRLFAGEQVADPVAGHDIDDRVGDPLAAREVGRVPDPDAILLPRNLGTCGNAGIAGRGRNGSPGSTTLCLSATRNSVEGETNTVPV